MPKPEEKPSEEKLEEKSNITETDDGGVSVTVEEDNPQEEVHEVKKEEVAKKESKPDSLHNKVYAQDRILSKIQQQLESLQESMRRIPSETKPQEQEANLDELDKVAQTDWKKAVSIVAERKAKELLENEKRNIQIQQEQINIQQIQDRNAESVIAKHQELNDPASEKSQLFQSILNNNPRWRTSPDGPLLTMYAMEDELRKRGYDVDGTVSERVEKETNRIIRATGSNLPASKTDLPGNKITLTREQKEFCDNNGISYEDYARTLRRAGEGRIEV